MFKKQHRLTSREFDVFFKEGKRIPSPVGQLIYAESELLKVSVVVPKKVIKTAVGRNRLRRQTYHLLKSLLDNKTGIYILIFNKNILKKSTEERTLIIKDLIGRNLKSR